MNEPISNATVAGNVALLDSGTNFTGYVNVGPGSNTVQVMVTDYNTNTVAHYYSVTLSNGSSQTLTYDLNGNLVTMTNTTTHTTISNVWDAANRLVAIYSNGTYRSVFQYDGLGRRVRQIEITGSTTNSDHWMLWCGMGLCEERDTNGVTVTKRFFSQGEQIGGTNYFFNRDHLGSIREMTDTNGTIRGRYSYDPWGRRTKVSGDLEADFGFTGHYFHAPSGLHLALYRAYSADLGRWLNRDPIEENGGLNLYGYVADDPVCSTDPDGLISGAVLLTGILVVLTVWSLWHLIHYGCHAIKVGDDKRAADKKKCEDAGVPYDPPPDTWSGLRDWCKAHHLYE